MRMLLLFLMVFSVQASIHWHQILIGSDYAQQLVGEGPYAKVGVVDTGFDSKSKSAFPEVALFRGSSNSGNPAVDKDGHGTAVTGMVASKETGVTSSVELSFYRLTTEEDYRTASNEDFNEAIIRACRAGNEIVNVSFGSYEYEIGMRFHSEQPWFPIAKELGCLVITSAGNSAIKKNSKEQIAIDDPILIVEATNMFSDEAIFSSQGMITAPGDGVYSVVSRDGFDYVTGDIENPLEIDGILYTSYRGTSFSAPVVTGVAAQIVSVLKERGKLLGDPGKRVALIKSILLASTKASKSLGGMVNALAAVLMAKNLGEYTIDQQELLGLLDGECAQGFYNLLVCEKKARINDIFESLSDEHEVLVTLINKGKGISKKKSREVLEQMWSTVAGEGLLEEYELLMDIMESSIHAKVSKSYVDSEHFLSLARHLRFKRLFSFEEGETNTLYEYLRKRTLSIFEQVPFFDKFKVIEVMSESGSIHDFAFILFAIEEGDFSLFVDRKLETVAQDLWDKWYAGELHFDW